MSVTRVNLGPLKVFTSNPATPASRPREPREGSFFGTLVRLPFVLFASALLFASLLAAFCLAFDLPGWMASGRVEPSIIKEMRDNLNTVEWPRLMRVMMGAGMFIAAVVGSVILMLARRNRGGFHMTRTLAGAGLLLWAPFLLAGPHVVWLPVPFMKSRDWVITLDEVLGHVTSANMLAAACAFVPALLLLLWPAPRRNAKMSADGKMPQLAPMVAEPTK